RLRRARAVVLDHGDGIRSRLVDAGAEARRGRSLCPHAGRRERLIGRDCMSNTKALTSLDDLVALIEPGRMLAIPKDESGPAMALTRALLRRGIDNLHLLCAPVCGLQADLLIGAGCVKTVECGAVVISEIGVGPRFREAVRRGTIELRDSTCPA